jgi:hypothetical protein
MGIRADILDTIIAFNDANNGAEPSKIHLTRADERALACMSLDEAGGPTSGKVREDWRMINGAEVVWDAPARRCE